MNKMCSWERTFLSMLAEGPIFVCLYAWFRALKRLLGKRFAWIIMYAFPIANLNALWLFPDVEHRRVFDWIANMIFDNKSPSDSLTLLFESPYSRAFAPATIQWPCSPFIISSWSPFGWAPNVNAPPAGAAAVVDEAPKLKVLVDAAAGVAGAPKENDGALAEAGPPKEKLIV